MLSLAVSENSVGIHFDGQITKEGISLLVWVQSSTSFCSRFSSGCGPVSSRRCIQCVCVFVSTGSAFLLGKLPCNDNNKGGFGLLP